MYKDGVAELLDGSEGDERASGRENADSVDVGFLEEFPSCSRGGVDLFWWFITLKGKYSDSIISENRNLTKFLRFSFHGISLKPRRMNICLTPAATAIEWLRCRGIAIFRTKLSISNVVLSAISETSLFTVRYFFANSFPAISSRFLASTKFRSLSDAIEFCRCHAFRGNRTVVFCIRRVVRLYVVSYASFFRPYSYLGCLTVDSYVGLFVGTSSVVSIFVSFCVDFICRNCFRCRNEWI